MPRKLGGNWLYIMPGLPMHLVQELNVGTPSRHWMYNVRTLYVQFRFALMDVHCMYGLGSQPVPKRNIRITYSLGSDRFSPNYQKSMCVWFWFTLRCTYGSVRTMSVRILYVNELNTVNAVNDLFLRKAGR